MNEEIVSPKSIRIETASVQDIPAITDMWFNSYIFHHQLDPDYYLQPIPKLKKHIESELNRFIGQKEKNVLVAKDGDTARAFLIYTTSEEEPNIGILEEAYVDETLRGKGIGSKLFAQAETDFQKQKLTHSRLQYSAYNTDAGRLYLRLGYIPDQFIMYKKLREYTPAADVFEANDKDIEALSQKVSDPATFTKLKNLKNGKIFVVRDEVQNPLGFIVCEQGTPEYDCNITNFGGVKELSAPDEETKTRLLQKADEYFLGQNYTHSKLEIPSTTDTIGTYESLGYETRQIVSVKNLISPAS